MWREKWVYRVRSGNELWVVREMGMNDDHVCMRIDEWVEGNGFRR